MLRQGYTHLLLVPFSLIFNDLDGIPKKNLVCFELFMLLVDKEIIYLSA